MPWFYFYVPHCIFSRPCILCIVTKAREKPIKTFYKWFTRVCVYTDIFPLDIYILTYVNDMAYCAFGKITWGLDLFQLSR